MDFEQRFRNAVYQVKFANMPGTHDNGEYRKELTAEQALDKVAKILGIRVSTPKPLYWVDSVYLYSRVTGRRYDILRSGGMVNVKYDGVWHSCYSERDAMNTINAIELREPATQVGIKEGEFTYHG